LGVDAVRHLGEFHPQPFYLDSEGALLVGLEGFVGGWLLAELGGLVGQVSEFFVFVDGLFLLLGQGLLTLLLLELF
jgi:hypothetical protein